MGDKNVVSLKEEVNVSVKNSMEGSGSGVISESEVHSEDLKRSI